MNAEGPYQDNPHGVPYTLLRTDQLTTTGSPTFTPGVPVAGFTTQRKGGRIVIDPPPQTTYLVFPSQPTPANVTLQLLGATDGVGNFTPFCDLEP